MKILYQLPSPDFSQSLINGLIKLKSAASHMTLASMLFSMSLLRLASRFDEVLALAAISLERAEGYTVGLMFPAIVGGIITLVAIYRKLIPSVKNLSECIHELSLATKLIKIGYYGSLIFVAIGILTLITLVEITIFLITLIFVTIGSIGLIIVVFRLSSSLKGTLFKIAGILFTVGVLISIIGLGTLRIFRISILIMGLAGWVVSVGWLFVYVNAGSVLTKMKQQSHPA